MSLTPAYARERVTTSADISGKPWWWRRAAGYVLGVIIPWSFLSQLLGTIFTGRSWPDGPKGSLISAIAFFVVILASALLTRSGQSPLHRRLGLQIRTRTGAPASKSRVFLRSVAHLADIASGGLGFFWPLWERQGHTFADKIAGTTVWSVP